MTTTETTEQQATTITALEDEYGETVKVSHRSGSEIIVTVGADGYYEPSPIRYIVKADGQRTEIDRDGFPIEDDDWSA